jgi:predicted O-methyltransferase YrrM
MSGSFRLPRPSERDGTALDTVLHEGLGVAARFLLRKYVYGICRRALSPSLYHFSNHTSVCQPLDLITSMGLSAAPQNQPEVAPFTAAAQQAPIAAPTISRIEEEFAALSDILRERYRVVGLTHPAGWAIDRGSSLLIYAIVRLVKPDRIVETGVANGHSTFFLLRALDLNQRGKLYSIDIAPSAGSLLSPQDKARWTLSVLPRGFRKRGLKKVLEVISPIDMFLHDSGHLYYWQRFEYETALRYMQKGGYILTDDADASFAFIDFTERHGLTPRYLVDQRKVFGTVRVC